MANRVREKGIFRENPEITKWVIDNTDKYKCLCGCEELIKIKRCHFWTSIPRYIQGHSSKANKEQIRETVLNYFKTKKGKLQAKQHGIFLKEYRKTHIINKPKRTKEQNKRHSEILKEKYKNGELAPWNKNKIGVYSDETLEKMALAKLGKMGKLSSNWQGGKSFELYSLVWNEKYREQIRYRYKYTCQLCGCSEIANGRKLDVHHIDYNKQNCKESNLISLCRMCHPKTNYNRRYWEDLFKKGVKSYV